MVVEPISIPKKYLFFIDDLDRIDPPLAVKILELLKNIFDLWYGGICFFAGMLVLTVGWEEFCILLKKWY